MKIFLWIIGAAIVLIIGFYAFNSYIYNEKQGDGRAMSAEEARYVLKGQVVKLGEQGVAYFGNEVSADINDDGREDRVFLITHQTGGSGTFYYAVAALNTENGWEGSQALFLGDRIAPQTTEVSQNPNHQNVIVVNYADRLPEEPMTAQPSVGKSIWIKLDVEMMQFGEVVQDFEGEANPDVMSLFMKSWTWVETKNADGTAVKPKQAKAFTLDIFDTGEFGATTDCNRIAGKAIEEGDNGLVFSDMISTKMYCEGSQEAAFAQMLSDSRTYRFTSRGEFILTLANGSEMVFQ